MKFAQLTSHPPLSPSPHPTSVPHHSHFPHPAQSTNEFVKFPAELEQHIMEGSYNRVLSAKQVSRYTTILLQFYTILCFYYTAILLYYTAILQD